MAVIMEELSGGGGSRTTPLDTGTILPVTYVNL